MTTLVVAAPPTTTVRGRDSLSRAIGTATGSYTPMSDVALFEARALDVLSRNPPLVGMYSTARTFAEPVFHPGPILFDLLATPGHRSLGGGGGMGRRHDAVVA